MLIKMIQMFLRNNLKYLKRKTLCLQKDINLINKMASLKAHLKSKNVSPIKIHNYLIKTCMKNKRMYKNMKMIIYNLKRKINLKNLENLNLKIIRTVNLNRDLRVQIFKIYKSKSL